MPENTGSARIGTVPVHRLGSPVALDYLERAPFPFTGSIDRVHIEHS